MNTGQTGAIRMHKMCYLGIVADEAGALGRQLPCEDVAAGGRHVDDVAADAGKGVQNRVAGAPLRVVPGDDAT